MKHQILQTKSARLLLLCAVCGLFFLAAASMTKAQTVTFAQFFERTGTQDFRFTNNNGANVTFDTTTGGSPILFIYQNIAGLDSSLQGGQNAHLSVTTTTTMTATLNLNSLSQPLNQITVISVLRDEATPFGVGTGNRTNLLTATISSNNATPALTGNNAANSGTFSVSTPDHTVAFTSDFVSFVPTTQRNLALSFSSVTPQLALGSSNFLQSFSAAGSGTFASDPPPIVVGPSAASVNINGRVLAPSGRGLRSARVNLTENNGTTRTVTTNSFGYYHFSDVPTGQAAILSVSSKKYSYSAKVVSVTADIDDMNFTVEQ